MRFCLHPACSPAVRTWTLPLTNRCAGAPTVVRCSPLELSCGLRARHMCTVAAASVGVDARKSGTTPPRKSLRPSEHGVGGTRDSAGTEPVPTATRQPCEVRESRTVLDNLAGKKG